jgi:hypothetical protein
MMLQMVFLVSLEKLLRDTFAFWRTGHTRKMNPYPLLEETKLKAPSIKSYEQQQFNQELVHSSRVNRRSSSISPNPNIPRQESCLR